MTDREFLRLHIEACWGISIPPLEGASVELPTFTRLPPWSLYQATLLHERVTIWRPTIAPEERANLLQRAQNAAVVFDPAPGMRREVVLRFSAMSHAPNSQQRHVVRLLTADDAALLEAFEAGSAPYYLNPHCAPCIGVIVDGQLVSVAHSSRRIAAACALGINTLPEARHHGHATMATIAWTQAIAHVGLTPIYSAFAHNSASLCLAAAAGYVQVCAGVYGPVSEADR